MGFCHILCLEGISSCSIVTGKRSGAPFSKRREITVDGEVGTILQMFLVKAEMGLVV